MKEAGLKADLCSRYCAYFRPGKDEALSCKGYLVVEKLVADRRQIPFDRDKRMPGTEAAGILVRSLCASCSFSEDGCDFAAGVENALPCGGFIFLGQLLECQIISVDDVTGIH